MKLDVYEYVVKQQTVWRSENVPRRKVEDLKQ